MAGTVKALIAEAKEMGAEEATGNMKECLKALETIRDEVLPESKKIKTAFSTKKYNVEGKEGMLTLDIAGISKKLNDYNGKWKKETDQNEKKEYDDAIKRLNKKCSEIGEEIVSKYTDKNYGIIEKLDEAYKKINKSPWWAKNRSDKNNFKKRIKEYIEGKKEKYTTSMKAFTKVSNYINKNNKSQTNRNSMGDAAPEMLVNALKQANNREKES